MWVVVKVKVVTVVTVVKVKVVTVVLRGLCSNNNC